MLKVYINNNQLEYDGDFNLVASLGDIRNLQAGSQLKTYTLNVQLTPTNKAILGFVDDISVERTVYTGAWMEFDEVIILRGSVLLLSVSQSRARLIITATDWIKQFDGVTLKDLTGLSTFAFNATNIESSWSAAYPLIRYPLVDNGALASGEDGLNADWWYIDFIPFFQVQDIITDVFAKYSIQSSINSATKWLNTYISGARTLADPSFIEKKGFEAKANSASDNQDDSGSIAASGTGSVSLDADAVELNNEVLDEGGDFLTSTDVYTVPETGNYRFKANIVIYASTTNWTVTASQYLCQIRGSAGILVNASCNQGDGSCITTVTLDTGYIQMTKFDTVWLDVFFAASMTNDDVNPQTFTVSLTTDTNLELDWSSINLLPAAGTYDVVDWLPALDQLKFLQGLKHAYNLQFFFDRENGNVYFEPADDMCTANVKDISPQIIETFDVEEITSKYKKTQRLKWQHDGGDLALVKYLADNTEEVGEHDITLSNPNCKDGVDVLMNPTFAPMAAGNCSMIWDFTGLMPRLWKSWDESKYSYAQEKLTNYVPRLVEWKGNTESLTWTFEGSAKTTIPLVEAIDFADQYTAYYLKTFYRINLGRLLTVQIKSDVRELSEFITVLSDDEKEGFRATYMVTLDGVSLYYVLNKITHNGTRAKLELLQKI